MYGLILVLLGFGAFGIIKGSCASRMQSSIGNVRSGSVFAELTSLGMRR